MMCFEVCLVVDFYCELFGYLFVFGLDIKINIMFNEIVDVILFEQDIVYVVYDFEYVYWFWCILVLSELVFRQFCSSFIGKCSLIYFFWGSVDFVVMCFFGCLVFEYLGGVLNCLDWVICEVYLYEVSSCGFWLGSDVLFYLVFYLYVYLELLGFSSSQVCLVEVGYNVEFYEFILFYDVVW